MSEELNPCPCCKAINNPFCDWNQRHNGMTPERARGILAQWIEYTGSPESTDEYIKSEIKYSRDVKFAINVHDAKACLMREQQDNG